MKLLVTGGAGCIGSVVALQLVRRGHKVTALEDMISYAWAWMRGHPRGYEGGAA